MNELQSQILNVYKKIKNICDENNLRYYAIGGTCIGAVRHNGFIPWDDDMDIAMPRRDYEKLKDIIRNSEEHELEVVTQDDRENYRPLFMKVYNPNTTYVESDVMDIKDSITGIFVDVMPLDGLPEEQLRRKILCNRLIYLHHMNDVRRLTGVRPGKGAKGLIKRMLYAVLLGRPFNYYSKRYTRLLKKYDFDESVYTSYGWSYHIKRLIYPSKWFNDYVEIKFEDTIMRCPVEYDKYLSQQFGDYMKLPEKVEQQGNHDIYYWDANKPYREYIETM